MSCIACQTGIECHCWDRSRRALDAQACACLEPDGHKFQLVSQRSTDCNINIMWTQTQHTHQDKQDLIPSLSQTNWHDLRWVTKQCKRRRYKKEYIIKIRVMQCTKAQVPVHGHMLREKSTAKQESDYIYGSSVTYDGPVLHCGGRSCIEKRDSHRCTQQDRKALMLWKDSKTGMAA